MNSRISDFYFNIFIVLLKYTVKAVPPNYCLHQLNTSDCHGTPTPVFSYYKAGSRCEIEIWRGCPTYNKFNNEYLCSNYCLFSFIQSPVTTATVTYNGAGQCSHKVTETCKSGPQNIAYTFNTEKQDCLPLIWGECNTANIFKEKKDCLDTCENDWKSELVNLTENDIKDLDEILSNFIAPNNSTDNKKLKLMDEVRRTSSTSEKEVTTLETTVSETVVSEEKTTEISTTVLDTTTEEVATEEITTVTESVTDEVLTTEVPKSTRRIRTRGTDYVSEVQLPDK